MSNGDQPKDTQPTNSTPPIRGDVRPYYAGLQFKGVHDPSQGSKNTGAYPENGVYYLVNVESKRVADLYLSGVNELNWILGWTYLTGQPLNQQWRFSRLPILGDDDELPSTGHYASIQSNLVTKNINPHIGYFRNGNNTINAVTGVVLSSWSQVWKIIPDGSAPWSGEYPTYRIVPFVKTTDVSLTLSNGETTIYGQTAQLTTVATESSDKKQLWTFVPIDKMSGFVSQHNIPNLVTAHV